MAGCVPTHVTFQINNFGAECMRVPMEESGSQTFSASGSPGGLVKTQAVGPTLGFSFGRSVQGTRYKHF